MHQISVKIGRKQQPEGQWLRHQRPREKWPLLPRYQLNIAELPARKIHWKANKIEVGFRSWRRTFGDVFFSGQTMVWFQKQMNKSDGHQVSPISNKWTWLLLLFCRRIDLPYEHWWATTLRESVHHTWHVYHFSVIRMYGYHYRNVTLPVLGPRLKIINHQIYGCVQK